MIRKVLSLSTLAFLVTSFAAAVPDDSNSGSPAAPSVGTANQKVSNEEIAALRAALANQQKQIDELRRTVEAQQKILERPGAEATLAIRRQQSLGEVASTTPIIPGGVGRSTLGSPVVPAPLPQPDKAPESAPLQWHLGNVTIVPVGFMDFTSAWRSTNTGSGIGSNFGSIPFLNTTQGRLSEFRLSNQNSRVGVRVDGDFKGTHVLGYLESDFLGTPTSNNFAITNHANLMRLRLYWVDVRKDKWELFGGQSWSMLTPGRTGISGLPGDIFYSQDIDVNYQAGLVWSRTPGMRVIYHPNSSWAMGVAVEDPEASVGGGRYIFGLATDVIVRGDGSLSPVHSGSMIQGIEFTRKNTLLYGYYGGVYISRNSAIDPKNSALVGYGFTGSPNSHNRTLQEY